MPKATVNWRIYELVKKGIIVRVGKGRFAWGTETQFHPPITRNLKNINALIKKQFPFINYCLWDTSIIKPFHQHLSKSDFILVDIEKYAVESVFLFLKEKYKNVFLKPDKEMMDMYVVSNKNSIIVRQLISESPTQKEKEVPTVTIEKLVVDIFSDSEFEYLKGSELLLVIKNIFDSFTVNKSRLLRYASRKGKQDIILSFLEKNNILQPKK
ncbi:MAG: hypothetical protein JST70_08010 [Bacteroidetes bacterium]|nr:hypothetical protein [Bacteroidota bacterium]